MRATETTTSLPELCEPLFQHVCRISRAARKTAETGSSAPIGRDESEVRAQIRGLLSELADKADRAGIGDQFQKVRLPLVFFCDYIIQNSSLPFAREWRPMSEIDEVPEHLGFYQEFFEMLEETIAERSEAADERLVIFYTCMGLGFRGWFEDNPKALQDKMREIANRIRTRIESESATDICEQAYKHTDKRTLSLPAAKTLTPIVISLVGLIVTLLALNWYLFNRANDDLAKARTNIETINQRQIEGQK